MTTTYLSSASTPQGLEGHYAGFVTRFASLTIDVVVIVVLFVLGAHVVDYIVSAMFERVASLTESRVLAGALLLAWAFVYLAHPLAISGRTLGMAVLGVRAVRADGQDLDTRHAVIRVLALPLSFLLCGVGFFLILLRRDRRALHDLIANTAVVYAWDARAARLRFLLKR